MKCLRITELCETAYGEIEEMGIRTIVIPVDKTFIGVADNGETFIDYSLRDMISSEDDFPGECQSSMVINTEVIDLN